MRRILDTLSIIAIAVLAIVSINLYITLIDEQTADKAPQDRLICDDVDIEFEIGGHYEYLGGCEFKKSKVISAKDYLDKE